MCLLFKMHACVASVAVCVFFPTWRVFAPGVLTHGCGVSGQPGNEVLHPVEIQDDCVGLCTILFLASFVVWQYVYLRLVILVLGSTPSLPLFCSCLVFDVTRFGLSFSVWLVLKGGGECWTRSGGPLTIWCFFDVVAVGNTCGVLRSLVVGPWVLRHFQQHRNYFRTPP